MNSRTELLATLVAICSIACTGNEPPLVEAGPPDSGSFVIEPERAWQETFGLLPEAEHQRFGEQVAVEGDDVYVTSYEQGREQTFWRLTHLRRSGGAWALASEVRGLDVGAAGGSPQALAVSEAAVFIGVPSADEVWRLDRDLSNPARLVTPAPGERFGAALAARGGRLFVGAPEQGGWQGAVYVFRIDAGAPSLDATLSPSMGDVRYPVFGASLAVDDETLYVGAIADPDRGPFRGRGAVHGFDLATLAPRSLWSSPGADGDGYGFAIAADGAGGVLVGAPYTEYCAPGSSDCSRLAGEVYLETSTATRASGQGLRADAPRSRDEYLGFAVAAAGPHHVAGAHGDSSCDDASLGAACTDRGVVYVLSHEGGPLRRRPRDERDRAQTGYAVALDGDTLVVGSPEMQVVDNTRQPGGVHIFELRERN